MMTAARVFVVIGLVFILIGGLLYLLARMGVTLGRLPGDLRIERGNFTCVLALGTSILLSIILTVILNLLVRLLNK